MSSQVKVHYTWPDGAVCRVATFNTKKLYFYQGRWFDSTLRRLVFLFYPETNHC